MGAWGTAIFSDDFALDVKGEYQTLLAFGIPEDEAYNLTRDYFFKNGLETDDDDYFSFMFAVSAIQQKYGILMPEVKEETIAIIDSGKSMDIWCDSDKKEIKKREQVLADLKEKLLSEPLPKRKVSKPHFEKHRWDVGDIVACKLTHNYYSDKWWYNKYLLFRVIYLSKDSVSHIKPDLAYNEWVYASMYNWIGDELCGSELIEKLNLCYCEKDEREIIYKGRLMIDMLYWIPGNYTLSLFKKDADFCFDLSRFEPEQMFRGGNEFFVQTNLFSTLSLNDEHFKKIYKKYE